MNKMTTRYLSNLQLTVVLALLLFSLVHIWAAPDGGGSACPLDFYKYPYVRDGECAIEKDKIISWDGFDMSRCCRNGLKEISQALALHANKTDTIFVSEDEWSGCNNSFHPQQSVSVHSCGFESFYQGSSGCSNFTLSYFKTSYPNQFQFVSENCSTFDPSFNDRCRNCTNAIIEATDFLMHKRGSIKNMTLRKICGVFVVTSVATAHILDPSWVGDFYSCLDALETQGMGEITIKSSVAKALLAIIAATMALILVIVLIKFVTRKKHPRADEEGRISSWSGLYSFSRYEIENAVNFSNQKISLGAGSAGCVYKGVLPSGQLIAIKHIFKNNKSDSFTREVEGLSRIRHPNLVCLLGCCTEGGEQYLVYEYCKNGNLAQHLLRNSSALSWDMRVKILRDCAQALRFLHRYPDGCIVHRDIKLTNILLTEKMEPKLSDFGLAKMLNMEESKVFTDVRGTIGYMDPEYMSNAKLTCASDIYSFGIVILQVLSGKKVIELDIDARDQLTRMAKDVMMEKRPLKDFEDPWLNGNLNEQDFKSILKLAVLCVARSSDGRPTVNDVFQEMDRAWKNTEMYMMTASKAASPQSKSLDVVSV
ncbi:hypothetical protein Syun_006194 [Stephania yunnanensis]|uniref:Protein kinase domain-containing protein n=1 Tax=Stephania yunnanensis TaxID=152371 RepID=A0AAP0KW52_9MAGN